MVLHFVFASLAAVILSREVELTSSLSEGQFACPGDVVTFTCTIRGSSTLTELVIAWNSTDYIGENALLHFTTDNTVGSNVSSMINRDVIATLTTNTFIDGVPMLKSQLRIIASTDFRISKVVCHNWVSLTNASVEFYIPGGL